jgi:hypothetical protein
LKVDSSRRNTDFIADLILKKTSLFDDLIKIYLKNEEPVSRRAVWVADVVTEIYPDLLNPFTEEIVTRLKTFTHDGMKREALKMLCHSSLPTKNLGQLITLCFEWLTSGKESVGVKIFSMELLYRISQQEPEMKKELADSIEWRMQEEKPGFRSRGKKLLKRLHHELQRI